MMSVPDSLDAQDPLILDRLVDGELTDAQERAVIAQLNDIPGGWRRCALAFLEARCWQRAARHVQELSKTQYGALSDPACQQQQRPLGDSGSAGRRSFRWSSVLALCTLFLLAVGIGMVMPQPWNRTHSVTAQTAPPTTVADHALSQSPTELVDLDKHPNSANLLLGNVKFVDNAGRQFDVPVYDWNEEVAEQLIYQPQPLSTEIVQQLKRHQLRSHQSFVPVKLQDGRQVVVPIQKLEIVPVGGIAY
jgi:hypothetical protein